MAYKVINGKLTKVSDKVSVDPNIAEHLAFMDAALAKAKAANKIPVVHQHWISLKPTVDIDTDTHFKADYTDSHGTYTFEILKTAAGYTVISDGNICSKDIEDVKYLIWNYECQLKQHTPKMFAKEPA